MPEQTCTYCSGKGTYTAIIYRPCPVHHGPRQSVPLLGFTHPCQLCNGTGHLPYTVIKSCHVCHGRGITEGK
jgi:DnaJ-class molecular chaperone